MNDIVQRKTDHLDIILSQQAQMHTKTTGFDTIQFEHVALPEMDYADIDLSVSFLDKTLQSPLLVSSMTGGPNHAEKINRNIAIAAQDLGIAFAVGSQRVALETDATAGLNRTIRKHAPDIILLANFGAAQLCQWKDLSMAQKAVDMIEANGLIIHLNPLQEVIQPEGDRNWSGVLDKIEKLVRKVDFPIIVKEVGCGISSTLARQLYEVGVHIIDVAGAGGTSWAAVEAKRTQDDGIKQTAEIFRDWGIPTAKAVHDVRNACPDAFLIASGGIRHGLDAAKALRLGANLVGQAAGALPTALESPDALVAHFCQIIEALKITCFCTGSANIEALRSAKLITPSKPY